MISYKKVGGLHFLKIGRLSLQWSIKKAVEKESKEILVPFHKQIAREIAERPVKNEPSITETLLFMNRMIYAQ